MTDTQYLCALLWIAANTPARSVHNPCISAAGALWREIDGDVLRLRARHHGKLQNTTWSGSLWSVEVDTEMGWMFAEPMETPTRQHAINALRAYAGAADLAGIPIALTEPTEPEICECCGQTIAEVA